MFSWICPRCGRDNPPSATKCLSCGTRFDEEPAAAEAVPLETEDPEPAAPVRSNTPRVTSEPSRELPPRRMPVSQPAPTRAGLPTWLMMLVVCFALLGIGSAIYFGVVYFRNRKMATSTGLDPAANVARTKLSNPLQKSVEVVGIRLIQGSRKKPEARFVIVNHGPIDLENLSATVTIWASTSRSEEDSVGTFAFKVPSLPGFASREIQAPLNTRLKAYELPDWQNATPEIEITSP